MIESGGTTQVGRGGVDCRASILESEAADIVCEKGENVGRKVEHHQMARVLLSHQPAGQQSEYSLHKEYEITGQKRPGEVCRYAQMSYVVRELERQRLFRRLRLIIVERLLGLGIVRSGFVSWLAHNKRITAGVGSHAFIAGCDTSGIRLRLVCSRDHYGPGEPLYE